MIPITLTYDDVCDRCKEPLKAGGTAELVVCGDGTSAIIHPDCDAQPVDSDQCAAPA